MIWPMVFYILLLIACLALLVHGYLVAKSTPWWADSDERPDGTTSSPESD